MIYNVYDSVFSPLSMIKIDIIKIYAVQNVLNSVTAQKIGGVVKKIILIKIKTYEHVHIIFF